VGQNLAAFDRTGRPPAAGSAIAFLSVVRSLDFGLCAASASASRDPPGRTVKLAPGGYHVMLGKLKKQVEHLSITLEFEKVGKATVSFDIGCRFTRAWWRVGHKRQDGRRCRITPG
jgi:hypothetical protein